MLTRLRRKNPIRPVSQIVWYQACWTLLRVFFTLVYRYRVWGAERVPDEGPLLVISNHQSNYDPVVVGLAVTRRHLNFVARSSLFSFKPFAWLIDSLNAHPVKQGASDTAAMRTYLDMLSKDAAVLIFPEGTRTPDGSMHAFKRGAWLLLSRAKCTVLPVGFDGAFDSYRRGTSFPKLWASRIGVQVGEPIPFERLAAMKPDEGLRYLERIIEELRSQAAAKLARSGYQVSTRPASSLDADDPSLAQA